MFARSNRMEFLGHQIGGDVITPSGDNLEKVRKTSRLTTKKRVRSLLGLVGYYRDHIPAFAKISLLLQEPLLKLPDLLKPFILRTDSSGVGVAAVLLQENEGMLHPIGYASKKLSLAKAKCPIIKKECLTVVWGIRRFKLYLAGKRFTLQTDHLSHSWN